MEEIAISEFKAKCLALLEQVRKTRRPIRVTRFGEPVADVVPSGSFPATGHWLGSMADTMGSQATLYLPIIEETDWEALGD